MSDERGIRVLSETLSMDSETERDEQGPRPPQSSPACLVLYYRDGVEVVPLTKGKPLVVGRAWSSGVLAWDKRLSRQHAQFLWNDEGVFVRDLSSKNGTFIRDERIDQARLTSGDAVVLGSMTAVLTLHEAGEESPRTIRGYDDFVRDLEREVLRARTFRRSLCLLMIKATGDDAHEHHVLVEIQSLLRPVDIVGVYGHATVLVAVPETDVHRASLVAKRLVSRSEVEVGIAEWPVAAGSAQGLVSRSREALLHTSPSNPVVALSSTADESTSFVVASRPMLELMERASKFASSPMSVLIVGETGTGKELVAQAIHRESGRAGRFEAVNCASIPESLVEATLFGHERGAFTGAERQRPGLFEQAEGGTVFLDEVGELPRPAQAALLRVLETKRLRRVGGEQEIEVDVRVVSATHRDLHAMCEQGTFRFDLLYRLNMVTLDVPPLRERTDDIQPLVEHLIKTSTSESLVQKREIDPEALRALRSYSWPGNVRELRNVIERALVIAEEDTIHIRDLPVRVRDELPAKVLDTPIPRAFDGEMTLKEKVRRFERDQIIEALKRWGGNQTRAAKELKMPLRTLVHKIRVLGVRKKY